MAALERLMSTALGIVAGLVIFLVASVMALTTGCKRDVTNDFTHGFSAVAGKWKTKVPLTLEDAIQHSYTSTSGLYLSVDVRPAAELKSPNVKVTTLPVGTEIRIEHLMVDNSTEVGSIYWVTGSLTSGPYAGKPLEIDGHLFAPNAYLRNYFSTAPLHGQLPRAWAVNPSELGK